MPSTSQTRLSSNPQLVWRKPFTTSFVGEAAVKFAGSGLGNEGACGAGVAGACAAGACGGAGGTCCCADAWVAEIEKMMSAAAAALWANVRINVFLLQISDCSGTLSLYRNLDGDGKAAPHAE